jgi:hypothetical protein
MKRVSEYLEYKKPIEEKEAIWRKLMKTRIEWWEKEYKRIINAKHIKDSEKDIICKEILMMSQLEIQGGECPRCSKKWIKVEFDNIFRCGSYYKPDCQCFFKCPVCKNHLYDSYVTTRLKLNRYQCPYCDWVLVYEDQKRHGLKYEIWYDNQKVKPANISFKAEEKRKEAEEKKRKGKK